MRAVAEPARTVTPALLRGWPLPPPGEDKHARGTVLVVGGAGRSPGAVLLAGLAALRAGAGRVQLAVAASAAGPLAIAVPEAMVIPLPHDAASGSVEPEAADVLAGACAACDVLLAGPGLDDADRTGRLVPRLLAAAGADAATVLDAYALGALAGQRGAASPGSRRVLTPNPGEAGILLGDDPPGVDALGEAAATIAELYGAVVTVRGHTAAPDGGHWVDGSGPVGLGTAGSGDVLAGTIAGLLARGADPAQAAVWGAHLHAAAGERLAGRVGPVGFLAREVLEELPTLLGELG